MEPTEAETCSKPVVVHPVLATVGFVHGFREPAFVAGLIIEAAVAEAALSNVAAVILGTDPVEAWRYPATLAADDR